MHKSKFALVILVTLVLCTSSLAQETITPAVESVPETVTEVQETPTEIVAAVKAEEEVVPVQETIPSEATPEPTAEVETVTETPKVVETTEPEEPKEEHKKKKKDKKDKKKDKKDKDDEDDEEDKYEDELEKIGVNADFLESRLISIGDLEIDDDDVKIEPTQVQITDIPTEFKVNKNNTEMIVAVDIKSDSHIIFSHTQIDITQGHTHMINQCRPEKQCKVYPSMTAGSVLNIRSEDCGE